MEESFIAQLDPRKDQIYKIIEEGQTEGSIRQDLSAMEIYQFLSQCFLSLFQRLVLRENHLKYEFCEHIDFQQLFKEIIIKGISAG